jgi:hypothetical protein
MKKLHKGFETPFVINMKQLLLMTYTLTTFYFSIINSLLFNQTNPSITYLLN